MLRPLALVFLFSFRLIFTDSLPFSRSPFWVAFSSCRDGRFSVNLLMQHTLLLLSSSSLLRSFLGQSQGLINQCC